MRFRHSWSKSGVSPVRGTRVTEVGGNDFENTRQRHFRNDTKRGKEKKEIFEANFGYREGFHKRLPHKNKKKKKEEEDNSTDICVN